MPYKNIKDQQANNKKYRAAHLEQLRAYDRARSKDPHRLAYVRSRAAGYTQAYRERFPDRAKASTRVSMRSYRIRNDECRKLMEAAKAAGCMDCGLKDVRVLQFDHARGIKRYSVPRLNSSLRLLQEELPKCDVVCANCHVLRTRARGQYVHAGPRIA